MAEFNYSMTEALNEDFVRAVALISVACERSGMIGINTYRSREIVKWLEENPDVAKSDTTFIFM